MTPKEKAKELVDKMYLVDDSMGNYPMCYETARQCALITVDEILNALSSDRISYGGEYRYEESDFWIYVKEEIKKL
jgi:hypothetical protein